MIVGTEGVTERFAGYDDRSDDHTIRAAVLSGEWSLLRGIGENGRGCGLYRQGRYSNWRTL